MNKYTIALLLCYSLLTGCSYQKADVTDLFKAVDFCSNKGGVKHITIFFFGGEKVHCINGETKILGNYVLGSVSE